MSKLIVMAVIVLSVVCLLGLPSMQIPEAGVSQTSEVSQVNDSTNPFLRLRKSENTPTFDAVAQNLKNIQDQGTAQASEATAQSIRAAQTATVEERLARTEAVQRRETQQANEATVQAAEAIREATAEAARTATAQSWQIVGWTATADSINAAATAEAGVMARQITATAAAISATEHAQAQSIEATRTQAALNVLAAQEQANIQQIEDKRKFDTTVAAIRETADMIAPWIFLVLLLVAGGFGLAKVFDLGTRLVRAYAVAKGVVQWMGGKPFFVSANADGSTTYVDMSKNPGPAVTVSMRGDVSNPVQADADVIQRSQGVEAILATGTGNNRGISGSQAANLIGQPKGTTGQPFVILSPEQSSKSLPSAVLESLDKSWQEAIEGEYREVKS